jgi:hypothetical protein
VTEVIRAAAELQTVCLEQGWRFCFIGGLALQRWGEPRETVDVGLTVLTGFGDSPNRKTRLALHPGPTFAAGRIKGISWNCCRIGATAHGVRAVRAFFPFTNWDSGSTKIGVAPILHRGKKVRRIPRRIRNEPGLSEDEKYLFARCLAASPEERWRMHENFLRSHGLFTRSSREKLGFKDLARLPLLERTAPLRKRTRSRS